jgi:RimJ/RimL family protein N-acetyltransferase
VVVLRLPSVADVEAIVRHVEQDQIEGCWLPSCPESAPDRPSWVVEDWIKGWSGEETYNGPALVSEIEGVEGFVGVAGFVDRGQGLIELSYGVAARCRGRGLATRIARLAGPWVLRDPNVIAVELRIAADHPESQRVACKAGFRLSGTVTCAVNGTGETFEDLRYVLGLDEEEPASC